MTVPLSVIWEITRECNFDCEHCVVSASKKRPQDEMDTRQCMDFLKKFSEMGGKNINFSGGEALLRQDLEEIMEEGKKWGFGDYSIASNGSLWTQERLKSLIKSGLDNVQISLDGATPEQNNRVRGGGIKAFQQALDAIRLIRPYISRIAVGVFLHPENIDSIPQIIRICQNEKVPLLRFSGFIPLGRGRNPQVYSRMNFSFEQMERFFRFFQSYDPRQTGVQLGFDHAFGPFNTEFHCSAGREIFYLSSCGDVYPCPSFLHPNFKCGNILNREEDGKAEVKTANELKEILNSSCMKSCQTPIELLEGQCRDCPDVSWCRGGCRGVTYAYKENLKASFDNCLRKCQRDFSLQIPGIAPPPDFKTGVKPHSRLFTPTREENRTSPSVGKKSKIFQSEPLRQYPIQKEEPVREEKKPGVVTPLLQRPKERSRIFGEDVPSHGLKGKGSKEKETIREVRVYPIKEGEQKDPSPPVLPPPFLNPMPYLDEFYKKHAENVQFIIACHPLNYLLWEATLNCNFNCQHCSSPREGWNKDKEMSTQEVKKVFDKIARRFPPQQFHALGITGGEPTLRKDLAELIRYFSHLGFPVAMDSNGFLMGQNPQILDQLVSAGLRILCISVDGLREEMKKFRGTDCYDNVMKTLEYAIRRHPGIFTQSITVVSKNNINSLDKIFANLENLGVPYARFGNVMAIGRAPQNENNFLSGDELVHLLSWIAEKRRKFREGKTRLQIEFTDNGWCGRLDQPQGFEGAVRDTGFVCTAGITMAVITYDGKMGACLSMPAELNIQGDLLTEDPLDIWQNRYTFFRDKNRLHIGECVDCQQWDYCQGGPLHERTHERRMKSCTYRILKCNTNLLSK